MIEIGNQGKVYMALHTTKSIQQGSLWQAFHVFWWAAIFWGSSCPKHTHLRLLTPALVVLVYSWLIPIFLKSLRGHGSDHQPPLMHFLLNRMASWVIHNWHINVLYSLDCRAFFLLMSCSCQSTSWLDTDSWLLLSTSAHAAASLALWQQNEPWNKVRLMLLDIQGWFYDSKRAFLFDCELKRTGPMVVTAMPDVSFHHPSTSHG